jgi:hypothetical protein
VLATVGWLVTFPLPQADGLAGVWRVSLRETNGVELDFRMTFAMTRRHPPAWEAYSREGAVGEALGRWRSVAGSLLGKLPPHGALVYIDGGALDTDGPVRRLRGQLTSPFLGRRAFDGQLRDGVIRAELRRTGPGSLAGRIEATREGSQAPFRSYAGLAGQFEKAVRAFIFDPALPAQPRFAEFFGRFATRVRGASDDLDVVGAFQALVPSLQTSHIALIRNPTLASQSMAETLTGDAAVNPESHVQLNIPAPGVAHLRVFKWDRVGPVIDRAFDRLQARGTGVLMLDIRGNSGGDHSSMSALAHLVDQPVPIGTFAGRTWYESRAAAPASAGVPTLTSESTVFQLLENLRRHGAVAARAVPRSPFYAGRVFVLVDRRTASASEPLAHALQVSRRATVVGERTAGSMLMALPYSLGDGWVATVPVADFVLPDGRRLEGRGVRPDVASPADRVFLAVADQIAATLPFDASTLRAGSLEALKRPRDAERAYRDAVTAASIQDPRPSAVALAAVRKRLAALLTARGDRDGARRQYIAVLELVPDDADATAALRRR